MKFGAKKGAKGSALSLASQEACAGARARGCAQGRAHAHTEVMAMAATGTALATRRPGRQTRERKRDGERGCARGDDDSSTCKKMIPSLARWPASQAQVRWCGGVRGHGDHALGSMAGLRRGKEGPFLTSVATGRSAGVGEEMVDAVKSGSEHGKTRKQGS
jgi:hypothetical protein